MLHGNYNVFNKGPGLHMSGSSLSDTMPNWQKSGRKYNRWFNTVNYSQLSATPRGYRRPYAMVEARENGDLASLNTSGDITVTQTLALAGGKNAEGTATITVTNASAPLQLIVNAEGTATITLTQAGALAGALQAVGATTIAFTAGPNAIGAIVSVTGAATITLSQAGLITAIGTLAGDITPYTELSPENLATAVWGKLVEGSYSTADIMRLLASIAAGKTDISGSTVTFRDLNDTKDRVTANMTGSERTTVTIDGAE